MFDLWDHFYYCYYYWICALLKLKTQQTLTRGNEKGHKNRNVIKFVSSLKVLELFDTWQKGKSSLLHTKR